MTPVTASTSYTALEPKPGDTPASIARKIELLSPRQYPTTALPDLDVLFLRQDLLESEPFELEGDLWSVAAARRLLAVQSTGYRCVIADDTYVHVPERETEEPLIGHLDAEETRLFESLENGADGPEVDVIQSFQDSEITLVPARCVCLLVDGDGGAPIDRSWIRLANDLIQRGVDVRVLAHAGAHWPASPDRLFRPIEEDADVLASLPAETHVFACTRRTASLAAELLDQRDDVAVFDFLADYERASADGIEPSTERLSPRTSGIGLLTTTEWARREIRHFVRDPEIAVRKIPLGIPLETFWPAAPRTDAGRSLLARTYGDASDTVLAAALHRVQEADPALEIRMLGPAAGPAFEGLHARFLGDLDEPERRDALHESDLYVSARPSRGLDLGGLEAMSCGRAAILANCGGTAEYARHDHNAYLFDPGDPEDLAAKILELAGDSAARTRLSERALSTIANYGRDRIAGEIEYVVNARHARRAAATRRKAEDVTCNIVIPVYNELGYVRMCLESIVRHTDYPYRVFIVDDGSDSHTKAYLRGFCEQNDRFRLIENETNLGFVASCNRGMAAAPSGDILLLNSDVIVTPDWLRKIVTCAYSDDRIGIVSPMSTRSSHLWIKMNPGDSIFNTAAKIEECSDADYPDIVTPEGWCFFIRRSCYDHLGGLDPIYGKGYCEESDFSMRALANGYRTVCADDTFVFHKGRVTFKGERGPRYKANRQIFDRRWKPLYRKLYRPFLEEDPLGRLRERYAASCHPEWIGRDAALEARKKTLKQRLSKHKGVLQILDRKDLPETLDEYRTNALEKLERSASDPVPQQVTFVLSTLERYGGVISVVQLANDLVLNGIDARIVVLNPKRYAEDLLMLTEPIFFRDSEEMARSFPPACNVVATLWITLYHIADVMREHPDLIPHYFVQDYEPLFIDESDPELRERVIETYRLPSRRFAKTRWIIDQVARHEADVTKVPPGLDLDVFYPRDVAPTSEGRIKILVMVRPKTTRRGFSTMLRVFPRLLERCPEVEIHAFGTSDEDLAQHKIPFRFVNHGPLEPHDLAQRYSASDIYADLSSFQGFGRTGLEAMACGAPCLLTDSGGVTEYAVDGENCLLVDPQDDEAILKGFERLVRSEELRGRLARAGLGTVHRFEKTYSSLKTWEFMSRGQYRAPEPDPLLGASRISLPAAPSEATPTAGLTTENPRKP